MQWNKWIIEQLPIRMRNIRMFALLRVLCSQVTNRYGAFSGFSKEQLGKLDIIPNPETLKQLVFEGSKARITIEEGNGLPYDFTIINSTVDGTLDLRLVDSILRKYKQAGKSFKYNETIIEAKSEWTDYVCEMEYVTSSFTKYVCEMKELPVCVIDMWQYENNDDELILSLKAKYALYSDVVILLKLTGIKSGLEPIERQITFRSNSTTTLWIPFNLHVVGYRVSEAILLSNKWDEHYEYKLNLS